MLLTFAEVVAGLDLEFCVFEEAGQEVLVAAERGQGIGRLLVEVIDIGGREVWLTSVLDVTPRTFHRVQLRTVGWQVFKAEPGRVSDREVLRRLVMRRKIVPDEYNPMTKAIVQSTQEWNQKRRVDVATVQLEGEVHPSEDGRDRKRPDRRDSITSGRFNENRRMARRCPGSTDCRLKHEPGFVQEHYRLTPTGRPFFIRGHSTLRHNASTSRSCCRARRWGFCGVSFSWRRILNT